MNDEQSRKLNSAVAGQTLMDTVPNPTIWNGKPAVVSKKTDLDNSIQAIGDIDDQINDTTGNAVSKSAAKETAAKTAWRMAKALAAFAEDTHDDVLRNEINFAFTELRYEKDATAIDRWQLVHDRANTHVAALTAGGYGVDAALVTQAQTEIDDFTNWRGKPRAAVADKKALNKSLSDEFKNLNKIIDSLKERLVQFAESNPGFYNGVIDAFAEDNSGVRHESIQIVFEDEVTGIKLSGVKAKLVEKAIEKLSSKENGIVTFTQQEAPQGVYTLEAGLPFYTSQTIANVTSQIGKLNKLTIKLKKV